MSLVNLGDCKINVRRWGDGDPLMLVHGLGASSDLWNHQVRAFAEGFEVIAVDIRGFGRSLVLPTELDFTLYDVVDDILAVCRLLDLGRIHFVGTSMGGFIGQLLALREPHLFRSLTLCFTGCRMTIPREVVEGRMLALQEMSMDAYGALVAEQALAQPSDPFLAERLREMIAANNRETYLHYLGTVLSDFDVTERISEIQVPSFVISGAEDRVIPPEYGEELSERLGVPNRCFVMPGVGHVGYVENPALFNQTVLDFIDKI